MCCDAISLIGQLTPDSNPMTRKTKDLGMMPLGNISIVIPCFNYGAMLLETLASVQRVRIETLAEVIVANDGSTDPAMCAAISR